MIFSVPVENVRIIHIRKSLSFPPADQTSVTTSTLSSSSPFTRRPPTPRKFNPLRMETSLPTTSFLDKHPPRRTTNTVVRRRLPSAKHGSWSKLARHSRDLSRGIEQGLADNRRGGVIRVWQKNGFQWGNNWQSIRLTRAAEIIQNIIIQITKSLALVCL